MAPAVEVLLICNENYKGSHGDKESKSGNTDDGLSSQQTSQSQQHGLYLERLEGMITHGESVKKWLQMHLEDRVEIPDPRFLKNKSQSEMQTAIRSLGGTLQPLEPKPLVRHLLFPSVVEISGVL